MKNMDININQARLLSYDVNLQEDRPEISATIGLYAGQKKISNFSITTRNYYEGVRFDLPPSMIEPILKIARELETITIRECNRAMAELPKPKG